MILVAIKNVWNKFESYCVLLDGLPLEQHHLFVCIFNKVTVLELVHPLVDMVKILEDGFMCICVARS